MLDLDLPPQLRLLAAAWATLFGAAVGSFLNVVIARVPEGQSIVRPRSRCPRCGVPIAWYDNVPVVSFLILRARCRACQSPISWRYPLVEALVAVAGYLGFERHGLTVAAAAELGLVAVLVALTFIDLDRWLLPHVLTKPLIGAGLLAAVFHLSAATSSDSAILGAAVGGGLFWAIHAGGERIFKKEAMGEGDVWLLAAIGAWLGLRALLPVLLLSSSQGAVVGIVQLLLGRGQTGLPAAGAGDEGQHATLQGPAPSAAAAPAPTLAGGAVAEDDWVPPRHSVPFGPFLALAALEWLYLAAPLSHAVPLLRPFL